MDGIYDLNAINMANTIANRTDDVALIGQNLRSSGYNISDEIIGQIKQHYFVNEHLIPVPGQVNKFSIGRFERTIEDVEEWNMAISGTMSQSQYQNFLKLLMHEYVEYSLMQQGIPFRGMTNSTSDFVLNYGAHELAPNFGSNVFSHWQATSSGGLNRTVSPTINSDWNQIISQIIIFEGI